MEKKARTYEYLYKKKLKKCKTNDERRREGEANMKIIMKRHNHLNKK